MSYSHRKSIKTIYIKFKTASIVCVYVCTYLYTLVFSQLFAAILAGAPVVTKIKCISHASYSVRQNTLCEPFKYFTRINAYKCMCI